MPMSAAKCAAGPAAAPAPGNRRKQQRLTDMGYAFSSSSSTDGTAILANHHDVAKPSLLLSMPLDMFFEVASHLKPVDILHLSRVSSPFQKMLLSRTSRRVWAAARRNIVPEIPAGPDDLSEPLYARLLFERDCTNCGAAEAGYLDYANYHRFCGTCWSQSVQPGGQLAYNSGFYYDPDFKKLIYDLLPGAPGGACHQAFGVQMSAISENKQAEHTSYHYADFAAVAEEYRQVCAGETTMSMKDFVVKHKKRTQARLLFQTEILMVELDRRQARAVFEDHMTDRKRAIAEKLRELDYEPEDYPAMDPDFHWLLEQRAALTPRIWSNIKPKLLDMLQAERTRRADEAFQTKWFMRMQELQPMYEDFVQVIKARDSEDVWARTMPTFGAAVKLPSMRALLASTSPSEHLVQSDFTAIKSALIRDVRAAMVKIQHHCANVLREAASGAPVANTSTTGTHKGKSAVRDTSKNKGKGKAREASEEAVQPDIYIEDLFADDPAAADRALLERPTSLFECAHPKCQHAELSGTSETGGMTFLGVLEHDAMFHLSPSWDTIPVRPAAEATRALMPRLLDSLGMPQGTTLSALHERLSNESPEGCSCGARFDPPQLAMPWDSGESFGLTNLLQHISGQWPADSAAGYNVYNSAHNQNTAHSITLEPNPAYPQGGPVQVPGAFDPYLSSASHRAPSGKLGAPGVPVGPTHPFVQMQLHAMAGMLNQPGALAGSVRAMLRSRKRR
ncbi:hypothetical protein C8T65DRAFT_833816 [Cerioporus squamosus]|nr:hypothetical protein C8T65DRAFT_833816 [Cerioporus squamosus]